MSEKGRYVTKASLRHITANDEASSSSGDFIIAHHSPALLLLERERTEGRKREKFYIYSDVTHTHTPGRSRVNPERQEEEKSEHRRRAKGRNSAGGGRGTDGPPKPTYTAKRTWPKHCTHPTMEITLDKNWIIVVIWQELSPVTCKPA